MYQPLTRVSLCASAIRRQKMSQVSNGGNGPVDAVYNAILAITGLEMKMLNYNLTAKGEGAEALGQVDIVVEHEGRRFHGVGLATDVWNPLPEP